MFDKSLNPQQREALAKELVAAKDVLKLLAEDFKPPRKPWAPGRKQVTTKEARGWVQYWTDDWGATDTRYTLCWT